MKTIDVQTLRNMSACPEARVWILAHYGEHTITLTAEVLEQVERTSWLAWLAEKLDSSAYETAEAARTAALVEAGAVFDATITPTREAYYAAMRKKVADQPANIVALQAAHLAATKAAGEVYNEALAPARAAYRQACIHIILTAGE